MTKPTNITVFIHAKESYLGAEYTFSAYSADMSNYGYIPVAKVEIPIPEITLDQIKARHLVLLRLERDEVYEKARKEAVSLDERIAKLEAIGYTPTDKEPAK